LVDFIGIGTQKAGTTWLWSMLRQHPSVGFAPVKEVHYFDVLYLGRPRPRALRSFDRRIASVIERLPQPPPASDLERLTRLRDPEFAFTDGWYDLLFSHFPSGVRTGDITPAYSALPAAGIQHVRRIAPQARLIYLVRDPIARGISALRHMTNEPSRSAAEVLASDAYFAHGDLRSSITKWERYFPREQCLYLPFGDVVRDPISVLRQVERHISIEPHENYRGMANRRATTGDSDLVVTEAMVQRVTELFTTQYDFLRERFGPDFVSRIA
jgi:hypothetical protein